MELKHTTSMAIKNTLPAARCAFTLFQLKKMAIGPLIKVVMPPATCSINKILIKMLIVHLFVDAAKMLVGYHSGTINPAAGGATENARLLMLTRSANLAREVLADFNPNYRRLRWSLHLAHPAKSHPRFPPPCQ